MTLFRQSGFSLIELLVSVMILGVVAAGLHQFYVVMSRSVGVLQCASEAEEGTRISIEIMQRDLRSAGFSPDGWLNRGVTRAKCNAVRIARDLNGDHDTSDSNERVAYSFDEHGRRLMRQLGDAPPQPMLNNLGEEGLAFSYYAGDGAALNPGDEGLSEENRKLVRRVDILIALEIPNPVPGDNAPIRSRQTASVSLRNDPKQS